QSNKSNLVARIVLETWNIGVRYLPPQPATPAYRGASLEAGEKAAKSGLSRNRLPSPRSHFAASGGQIAESLQANSRIFPFSGDRGRRLGSIATAARGEQSNRTALSEYLATPAHSVVVSKSLVYCREAGSRRARL